LPPPGAYSVTLGGKLALVENIGRIDVDKRIEAFVHPGIGTLVTADDHGKPVVPDLMRRHPNNSLPLSVIPSNTIPGYSIPAGDTGFIDGYRIG
jgi:hypothetical protein